MRARAKLVILNGSPAAGKSTIAKKLHRNLPMALLIDLDVWRRFVNGWKENREESLRYVYQVAIAAVGAYLQAGHSVIVDKAILNNNHVLDALVSAGKKHRAEVFEFILIADKTTIIARANKRRSVTRGRILASNAQVMRFWDIARKLVAQRQQAIVVDTSDLTPNEAHQLIEKFVFARRTDAASRRPALRQTRD